MEVGALPHSLTPCLTLQEILTMRPSLPPPLLHSVLQEIATMMRVLGSFPMDREMGFTTSDDPLASMTGV